MPPMRLAVRMKLRASVLYKRATKSIAQNHPQIMATAAETLSFYHTVKRLGIPDSQIILMMAEDFKRTGHVRK